MEEISKNKAQLAELEAQLESRDKEIKYLKRALESVYTRFQSYRTEVETPDIPVTSEAAALSVSTMASKTLEALAERDRRIAELSARVQELQSGHATPIPKSSDMQQEVTGEVRRATRSPPSAPVPPPPPPLLSSAQTSSHTDDPASETAGQPRSRSPGVAKLQGFGAIKVVRQAPKPPGVSGAGGSSEFPADVTAKQTGTSRMPPPPPPPPPAATLAPKPPPAPGTFPSAKAAPPPPPPPPSGLGINNRGASVAPLPPSATPQPIIKISAPVVRAKLKVRQVQARTLKGLTDLIAIALLLEQDRTD